MKITPKEKRQIQSEKIEALFKKLKEDYNINIAKKGKRHLEPENRSLFNTICSKVYKINNCSIARFYESKGKKSHPSTVWHSIDSFNIYTNYNPKLLDMYFKLAPGEIDTRNVKVKLTKIHQAVSGLTESQEYELLELIEMKKKSWLWKSKDTITVLEAY